MSASIPPGVTPVKQCCTCNRAKPTTEFHRNRHEKDGYHSQCKDCRAAYSEARRVGISDKNKRNYQERVERDKAQGINPWSRYHRNPVRARERQKKYDASHKDQRNAANRAFHARHREQRNKQRRQHERAKPWLVVARTQRRRAQKRGDNGTFSGSEWQALKAQYGYCCLCCGKQEPEIKLHSDHVVPLSRGGRNDIANLQPLCRICNSKKGTKTIDYRQNIQNT